MSADDVKALQAEVLRLQKSLQAKEDEVSTYKNEFLKISKILDQIMVDSQNDVKILSRIHKLIVPTELPSFPGFEMSKKFVFGSAQGGDYFDIFEHEDKFKFGVLISAASGYTMSALFLALVFKVSHLLAAKKGLTPQQFLQRIAQDLQSSELKDKDRSDVFYAVIDRKHLRLTFACAGVIVGFYQTPQGVLHRLSSNLSSLGRDKPHSIEQAEIELEPKGRLVLSSPGLLEVLTQDEIAKIIETNLTNDAHHVRHDLIMHAQMKSGLEIPRRDQTVVVIDIKDNIIKLAKS